MFLENRIGPLWESHHGKGPFIRSLPLGARILDVGCGNNSPGYAKHIRPDLYYIGLDVGDYNQDHLSVAAADEYHISTTSQFSDNIERLDLSIDGVVSSHNLEHCDDYRAVLRAMVRTLKPGGRMYLSFPCEASARFPHRRGTLNFFDDLTHQNLLSWHSITEELATLGMIFEFRARRYRPLALALIGLLYEPLSAIRKEVLRNGATWALYGFESVIWARRDIALACPPKTPSVSQRTAEYSALSYRLETPTTAAGCCMNSDDLPAPPGIPRGIVRGRSVYDGYARGVGLEYGDLAQRILADPLYIDALRLAAGRTIQDQARRMNVFLILKFFVPKLPPGDVIEFGAYKGGSAIFMAKVCVELGFESQVWALDTFAGMPPSDKAVDHHNAGDFADTNLDELQEYTARCGLTNLHWVKGPFEETTGGVLARAKKLTFAHIDCDIRSAVRYSYNSIKHRMVDGGYIVFDDATASSCIGATEVVEQDVIRRDGLNCEQIYPHFVFRRFDVSP